MRNCGLGRPGLCEHVECHDVAESEMDVECGKQEISISSERMTNIPYLIIDI